LLGHTKIFVILDQSSPFVGDVSWEAIFITLKSALPYQYSTEISYIYIQNKYIISLSTLIIHGARSCRATKAMLNGFPAYRLYGGLPRTGFSYIKQGGKSCCKFSKISNGESRGTSVHSKNSAAHDHCCR
jgi:hypothetical protein